MTGNELIFMSLGLAVGAAAAAGLISAFAGAGGREVRVTVAPESIPRRLPATLAVPAFMAGRQPSEAATPAGGGPADVGAVSPEPPTATIEPDSAGPCVELRRAVEERCAMSEQARRQASRALDALHDVQRTYDFHMAAADEALAIADPRAARTGKEIAQANFQQAHAQASTPDTIEAAARDWLREINRINHDAREATSRATREREAAAALFTVIERLTVEADAARINAEIAEEGCLAAREAVADCDEAEGAGRRLQETPREASLEPIGTPVAASVGSRLPFGATDDDDDVRLAATADHDDAVILRLLRGDRASHARVVESLAGEDPEERRRWQRAIAELLEAIIGRAIDASALDFPTDHPFWGPSTREQNREIVSALSSLGYRFDGLGGWLDDRVPGQRDLSLAIGYAGLDPVRIRHWPSEAEMGELFRNVTVAADEYLAEAVGGLTLGELVSLLGRRAEGLTELWNAWGRVRPLLLSTA